MVTIDRPPHARQPLRVAAWVVALVLAGCATHPSSSPSTVNPIELILTRDNRFASLVDDAETLRLQVVLGVITHDRDGRARLVQHGFRLGAEYFYPASSIKLCAAIAALEQLATLRSETGLPIDADTPLVWAPQFEQTERVAVDESNRAGGVITVGHEIRKLFLVSDNEAYNRLFEFVGPAGINASMHRAGLDSARIVHRLSESRSPLENRQLPAITLRGEGFQHVRPARVDPPHPSMPDLRGLLVGRGYLRAGERIDEPLDFETKNAMSLADLQRALCMVTRPDIDCGGAGFALDATDRERLLAAMRPYPRQSTNPAYDPASYPDDWVKFLLPGLRRVVPDDRLEIANKVGNAYGFSIENAYVADRGDARHPTFFLAATLYTNRDGILNDDQYEYDEIAFPFFADLGEAVARHLWR